MFNIILEQKKLTENNEEKRFYSILYYMCSVWSQMKAAPADMSPTPSTTVL